MKKTIALFMFSVAFLSSNIIFSCAEDNRFYEEIFSASLNRLPGCYWYCRPAQREFLKIEFHKKRKLTAAEQKQLDEIPEKCWYCKIEREKKALEDFTNILKCTSSQCREIVKSKLKHCWDIAHAAAVNDKEKRLAQQLKQDSGVTATQALNKKAAAQNNNPVVLTAKEKEQVQQAANNALKDQLRGERCIHVAPQGSGFACVGI